MSVPAPVAGGVMRAAVADEYGPPENVHPTELPIPAFGDHEVLVRVAAAAVNFPDILLVAGQYQVKLPMPLVPGSDFAGHVVAAGAAVTSVRVGDRVRGTTATGAFAEYVAVDAAVVRQVPEGADLAEAAALSVVYSTAWHSLHSVAQLRAGERVCVLGAAGGVGLACVDLAVLAGAEVIAVATGVAKSDLCRARGAAHTIDVGTEDLRAGLKELGGIDVVIDMVGGPATEQALRALRPGGRLVTVGYASGQIPAIPLNLVLLKGITILGFEMRTFVERFPEAAAQGAATLDDLLAAGAISPHIGARFRLSEAAAALRTVADRAALGKIVIDVTDA